MLSNEKLNSKLQDAKLSMEELGERLSNSRIKDPVSAVKNWQRGLMKPSPRQADIDQLAQALDCESTDLMCWKASHMYAPIAPRKSRLVVDLVRNYPVQEAMDLLKFANKRAAVFVEQVLRSAVQNAVEQSEVDPDQLYISEARVDEGGVRRGTRRWRPKDRGRAVSWTRLASHIHITVDLIQ